MACLPANVLLLFYWLLGDSGLISEVQALMKLIVGSYLEEIVHWRLLGESIEMGT